MRTTPSLGDALAWLDRHINLEAIERGVAGRAAEPTLSRVAGLLAALDDPQRGYPIVHVTGTNGKGSTTRMCTQLLVEKGLSVGTYTSPHLEMLNERIAVNEVPISDEALGKLLASFEQLEHFVSQSTKTPSPTWFELVTACAYGYFADAAVDAAVVEVGLGGRFDATNVADGNVAILTNVDLDHVDILGPTKAHIAAEKAGIVKAGSIVVCGEQDPDLVEIIAAEAANVGAEAVWRRGIDFETGSTAVAHGGRSVDLRTPTAFYEDVFLPLYGAHQADNAAAALTAAEAFFGGPLDEALVREAFAAVRVPGRLEVVASSPFVVLDGAHNEAGARALSLALEEDFAHFDRVVLVAGCLRGRDPEAMLRELPRSRIAHVVCCTPASPRALPASLIEQAARSFGWPTCLADTVSDALDRAVGLAENGDLVLVTGSLYVVGAARTAARRLASTRL